ncbi:MAG: type II secretion system protein [Verrucomicrobiales bacterium]|nr:type II secretion system protein [Verrucomicrobiales bacterium]
MRVTQPHRKNWKARAGFTLMELLVVIVIIGILASFMFPVATGVLRRAEDRNAENTCHNLKNGIAAYFTEYRKYPVLGGSSSGDEQLFSDHTLMDVLLAAEGEARPGGLNPRRIVFFSGRQARPAAGGKYRKGIKLESGGAGELWDPYAEYYRVILDTDYNNRIMAPSWASDDSSELPATVIVWSAGRDNEDNEARDNITTW